MTDKGLSQEQLATNAETWDHIFYVMKLLAGAQRELMRRQFTHDQSKLQPPEVEIFTEKTAKLRSLTYGSAEYMLNLQEMGVALEHHYAHNRHHPEFFPKHFDTDIPVVKALLKSTDLPNEVADRLQREVDERRSPVNGMNLFDLIEMVCDWYAATKRHADGDIDISFAINRDRFDISPQLLNVMRNTVDYIIDDFAHLSTQRDIRSSGASESPLDRILGYYARCVHATNPIRPGQDYVREFDCINALRDLLDAGYTYGFYMDDEELQRLPPVNRTAIGFIIPGSATIALKGQKEVIFLVDNGSICRVVTRLLIDVR